MDKKIALAFAINSHIAKPINFIVKWIRRYLWQLFYLLDNIESSYYC